MLSVQFCGAARTVTGSQYYLEYIGPDGSKFNFCIDSGMFQVGGKVNLFKVNSHLVFDPKKLDVIVLTHAHLDHCGRIPYLVKSGFGGRIFSTEATRQIAEVVMTDAAKLSTDENGNSYYFPVKNMTEAEMKPKSEKFNLSEIADQVSNEKFFPKPNTDPTANLVEIKDIKKTENLGLYGLEEVEQAMTRFKTYDYHHKFMIHPNLQVEFWDAGHILGSAYLNITELSTGRNVVFSGDLGNIGKPIIEDPEMPKPISKLTHIFTETTYGDKFHGDLDPKARLRDITFKTLNRKGKLLIPAFSIERCQEVIYYLTELMRENLLPSVPIYLDSPMGSKVLKICLEHPELYDAEMKKRIANAQNPLIFKQLKILDTADDSKSLNHVKEPCIIIAGSGMLNGGRILKHLVFHIEDEKNTILMVGYQAEGTLGRKLQEGEKKITLEEKELEVRAEIAQITEFSAHADQKVLKDWLSHWILGSDKSVIPTLFLMHGEKESALGYGREVESTFPGQINTYWPYFAEKKVLWE